MEVNFDFIKKTSFNNLHSAAEKIQKLYTIEDYRDAISNARLLLETITKRIFQLENLNQYYHVNSGEYRNLRSDTHYLRTELDYPLSIMNLFDEVRRMGNEAIHDSKIEPDKKQAFRCICDLHDILVFLINSYDEQDFAYLRPDIAMEAQTDTNHYHSRKNKSVHPIKLQDHYSSKKKHKNHHLAKKHPQHFSSSPKKAKPKVVATSDNTKQSWFEKIKKIFSMH